MAESEEYQQLAAAVTRAVERATDDLKAELLERLHQQQRDLESAITDAAPAAAESYIDTEQLAPLVAAAGAGGRRSGFEDLHQAVAEIDAARSQGDLLRALLAGSGHFASRSALFLTRPGELLGWAGQGFEDDVEPTPLNGISFHYREIPALDVLAQGHGAVTLNAAGCARLCSRIETAVPREGVLVPLVLRDRVAAALYADRLEEGDDLDLTALEVLAFVASLALETLPLRSRATTPSLRRAEEAADDEAGLPLWDPAELEAAGEAAPAPVAAAPSAVETPPETPATEEPAPWAYEDYAGGAEVAEPAVTEEPAAEPDEEEPAAAEETVADREATTAEEEATTAETFGPEGSVTAKIEIAASPEPPAPAEPAAAPAEPMEEAEEPVEAAPPAEPAELSQPPAPAAPEAARTGLQVAPPADVAGPGRAFASAGAQPSSAEEEARRLARLLVSEIKLYNEDQVEEGRRSRDLYERLKDDIDRSRQIYEERTEERARQGTDFFYQELVRILAGGDAKALGM